MDFRIHSTKLTKDLEEHLPDDLSAGDRESLVLLLHLIRSRDSNADVKAKEILLRVSTGLSDKERAEKEVERLKKVQEEFQDRVMQRLTVRDYIILSNA